MKNYLRQCLRSIYQSSIIENIEIIVVDNYSHDHTCEMIEYEFPKVRIIKNKNNVGFSKGINIGQKFAKGEYFCFLNPDTLISDNTFEVLLEYLDKYPQVGCIGPKILNADGTLLLASRRSFPYPMAAFF